MAEQDGKGKKVERISDWRIQATVGSATAEIDSFSRLEIASASPPCENLFSSEKVETYSSSFCHLFRDFELLRLLNKDTMGISPALNFTVVLSEPSVSPF
ncbi:hypothetical protein L2E82_46312 [Cichorium intybus]|uniref:Uncharacterized protein n=1 Tax=Cichorium intybus TaxID=13427 RepID=A0ACB8YTJ1_CICIN|nr:hypothetical protein L2E82_46312 [Cichorium intybus]